MAVPLFEGVMDRLEEGADRDFVKFSKFKCRVLHLRKNNSAPLRAGGQSAGKQLGRKTWASWWTPS